MASGFLVTMAYVGTVNPMEFHIRCILLSVRHIGADKVGAQGLIHLTISRGFEHSLNTPLL